MRAAGGGNVAPPDPGRGASSHRIAVGDPLLEALETLPLGSAKVPRLPVLVDLLAARDDEEALRALVASETLIAAYGEALHEAGHHALAGTVRRALKAARSVLGGGAAGDRRPPLRPARLNSDTLSLLELIYAASLKTAGATTMTFVPWTVDPARTEGAILDRGQHGGRPHLRLADSLVARLAQVNAVMYGAVLGALNEAVRTLGPAAAADLVATARSLERAPHSRFTAADDVKCMAKIDYKIGGGGRPTMVDLNAGLIGTRFDDELASHLGPGVVRPGTRIAGRLAQAIIEVAAASRGSVPRRAALVVLDEQMYETWRADDIDGLLTEVRAAAQAAGATMEPLPVVTMAALVGYARRLDEPDGAPSVLGDAPWRGIPDALVFYTGRIGQEAGADTFERLRGSGSTLVDERHHSLLAVKAMADPRFLPLDLLGDVVVPEVVDVGCVDECTDDVAGPLEKSWLWATGRHEALAIKIEKVRRGSGPGDHATAFIYPVTAVGRRVAARQLARATRRLCADGWGEMCMHASPVDLSGGLVCGDGLRYDVEVRTYVFPCLRAG